MNDKRSAAPDSTAVRVALWRAMHVQADAPPHVFEDEIGLRLAAPRKTGVVLLLLELADAAVRPGLERAVKGARASGTPFLSFFTPAQMLTLARESGFREAQHVSADALAERYFAGRTDGLRPPSNAVKLLAATT